MKKHKTNAVVNTIVSDSVGFVSEQTRQLFNQWSMINALALFCIGIVLLVYWQRADVSHISLLLWTICGSLLMLGQFTLHWVFHQVKPSEIEMQRWRSAVLVGAFFTGSLFGFALVRFNVDWVMAANFLVNYNQVAIGGVILGLAVASLAAYASYFKALVAFITPLLTPAGTVLLFADSNAANILGILTYIFIGFVLLSGRTINKTYMGELQLQYKNQALIRFLEKSNSESEGLNQKLAIEIRQRQQVQQQLQSTNERLEELVEQRTIQVEATYMRLAESEERLSLAMDASEIGLWDWNLETDEIYHSNFEKLLGYSSNDITGFMGHLKPLVHPDDYRTIKKEMVLHLKKKKPSYHTVYRIKNSEGDWRWMEDDGRVVAWNEEGMAKRMIGTRRDITEQTESHQQQHLLSTVFNNSQEAIFILDPAFHFITANDVFTQITGYEREEIIGRSVSDIRNQDEGAKSTYAEITRRTINEGNWQGELTERRRNGEAYPEWLQLNRVTNEQGDITHFVGMFSDLTARKKTEEKLKYLSNYDKVTGLANRTLFRERLHNATAIARLKRQKIALFHIDLDRFRLVNDSMGHEFGDALLEAVGKRISQLDVPADTIARISGDEFSLIFDDVNDNADLEGWSREIINSIRQPFFIRNQEVLLGASIGICLFPEGAREMQMLINHAGMATQRSKRMGGNTFSIYSEDMQTTSVDQLNLESALRKAIFRKEFVVYYQPKLDLASNRIYGAEALVRWQHPELGLLQPGDFIALAEQTGLVAAIGELVLETACRQLKKWHDDGHPDLQVAVNLAAQQIRKGDLPEVLDRVLEKTDLASNRLELELTESQILDNAEAAATLLQTVREKGITIALDDFGTGYSSLSYLRKLPIDVLKIDRAFIKDMHTNEDEEAIVKAIVAMTRTLNLEVVAEGVEEKEQMDMLKEIGCESVQGYLIGRPMPAAAFAEILEKQQAINVTSS